MSPLRLPLHLLAALLTLLFAAVPAASADPLRGDPAFAVSDSSVQPPKQADHGTRRPRHTASLEEFFEIDDDAEQYFKPPPAFALTNLGFGFVVEQAPPSYSTAPPSHRACAAYPTGPPHA